MCSKVRTRRVPGQVSRAEPPWTLPGNTFKLNKTLSGRSPPLCRALMPTRISKQREGADCPLPGPASQGVALWVCVDVGSGDAVGSLAGGPP